MADEPTYVFAYLDKVDGVSNKVQIEATGELDIEEILELMQQFLAGIGFDIKQSEALTIIKRPEPITLIDPPKEESEEEGEP